jgi:hypothetical protein
MLRPGAGTLSGIVPCFCAQAARRVNLSADSRCLNTRASLTRATIRARARLSDLGSSSSCSARCSSRSVIRSQRRFRSLWTVLAFFARACSCPCSCSLGKLAPAFVTWLLDSSLIRNHREVSFKSRPACAAPSPSSLSLLWQKLK